ncbi:hypothetical protein [Rhizobium sp. NPDC090279]|uniref:hypothetical protein n=1 Tax=Rhizobium sp. NPDC090279 TaxID=3364499 RepID=UPI00383B7D75
MCRLCNLSIAVSPFAIHGDGTAPRRDVDRLIATEMFPHALQQLAYSFIAVHEASPILAELLATQQRWLLYQAALAHHFWSVHTGGPKLTRLTLVHLALQNGLSSRNTANSFFAEALRRDIISPIGAPHDDDTGEVVPSSAALSLLPNWYQVHFEVLDRLLGGDRRDWFLGAPEHLLTFVQPHFAYALLSSPDIRAPGPLYTIFTWADAGGLLMDRLIAGIDPDSVGEQDRHLTDISAVTHLARASGLSRAHTSRKLSAAEVIGGIGWSGRRGRSALWVSRGFYEEYAMAQALKLLILNHVSSRVRALLGSSPGTIL